MVLISPYRPASANPLQIQPTNVSGSVGRQENRGIDATVTTSSGRTTVLDGSGGFTSSYESDYDWIFVNTSFDPNTMSTSFGTLNGANAITITWDAGASTGDRWAGAIDIGSAHDEAWFTCEFMMSAGFSTGTTQHTGKICGLTSANAPSGCVPVACDEGWGMRQNWVNARVGDDIQMMHYGYYPDKTSGCGQNLIWPTKIQVGVLNIMEQHIVLNSDKDTADAVVETKVNGVLVSNTPGLRLYCDSEANRAGAENVDFHVFWGGSGSSYSPAVDSSFTFGRFKVEIPA